MVAGEILLPHSASVMSLHTAHGNACQVHLDEGSLEGHALETRHVERDVAGSRGEVAVIVAAAVALMTGLAALVAGIACVRDSASFPSSSFRFSSTLLRTNSLIWPLITSLFSCTIFSDIVCCLVSNVCVVTSFYQSLQAMSSFMRFSICATYCTLSYESGRIAWIYGETKLSGKINIQRSCFSSYYYCSSTAQFCGKLHGAFCTYRIFMRNTDK